MSLYHCTLHDPAKSFDEKLYRCKNFYKHLCKTEIPYQAVCNKMTLDLIPDELKDLERLE